MKTIQQALAFVVLPLWIAAGSGPAFGEVLRGAVVMQVQGASRSWHEAEQEMARTRGVQVEKKVIPIRKDPRRKVLKRTPAAPAEQSAVGKEGATRTAAKMPAPASSFEGMNLMSNGAGWPPDTNGDVGITYYVETVNTSIGIYRKSDGGQVSTVTFDSFFGGSSVAGTPCDANNQGDPTVLFDPYAQRWILMDFAWAPSETDGSYFCIAASKTSDPTGDWWVYAMRADNTLLNDYPKQGIWSDGIYITANMFQFTGGFEGARIWALRKPDIYNGTITAQTVFDNSWYAYSILPANARGPSVPESGTPNYMFSFDSKEWGVSPEDVLSVWTFNVDWDTPANTTWTGPTLVTTDPFDLQHSQIPQQGTSQTLDNLGDRLMYPAPFRNFDSHQSIYLCHTVSVSGVAGVRWYEVRLPGGTPAIYQQGTFSPDTNHRWMGSITADGRGNIAVGYSVSSSSLYPGIRYAGRLSTDPAGQLSRGEASVIEGTGSQLNYNRWGDYTSLSIDPVDDATFWYANEYYATTGTDWHTRIASFRFPARKVGTTPIVPLLLLDQ
jgi:hypothetical protein